MLAPSAMAIPIPAAVNSAFTAVSSGRFFSSMVVSTAAGKMPQLPAVGDATIRPMQALHSDTAKALASALPKNGPHKLSPLRARSIILALCPPDRPLSERKFGSSPSRQESRITERLRYMCSSSSSFLVPVLSLSRCSTTSESVTPSFSACSTRSFTVVILFLLTGPGHAATCSCAHWQSFPGTGTGSRGRPHPVQCSSAPVPLFRGGSCGTPQCCARRRPANS